MPVHVSWGRHVVNVRCDWLVCLSSKVWETRGIFLGIHEFLWFFSFFLQNNLVPTNYDIGAYLAGDQVIHSGQVMQYGSVGSFVMCHALYSKLSIITLQCRPMSIMTSQITGKSVYLFNSFFRLAATKISKIHITVPLWWNCGNPEMTSGFPSQSASNVEKASPCHDVMMTFAK